MKLLFVAALTVAAAPAFAAEVYRCADGDSVVYKDRPCAPGYTELLAPTPRPPHLELTRTNAVAPEKASGGIAVSGDRQQIEAEIHEISRRLDVLQQEKYEAVGTAGSSDAAGLNRHYDRMIRPLEEELSGLRNQLEAQEAR